MRIILTLTELEAERLGLAMEMAEDAMRSVRTNDTDPRTVADRSLNAMGEIIGAAARGRATEVALMSPAAKAEQL